VIVIGAAHNFTRDGPETLDEVIQAAERQGLHWRIDGPSDNGFKKLLVSAAPLRDEEAESISCHTNRSEVVTCYVPGDRFLHNWEEGTSLLWGNVFVIGDP